MLTHQRQAQAEPYLSRDTNAALRAQSSPMERFAMSMVRLVGSPGFFVLLLVWTGVWITVNLVLPLGRRFDEGMKFEVWIFLANIIQLFLMPLLLIAQNLQLRHDKLRADNDFQVTLKSEQELEVVLGHLYLLSANMKAVMDHLGLQYEVVRSKDRIPDLVEEQFAVRQQQLLDEMAQKLAQTHEATVRNFQPPSMT